MSEPRPRNPMSADYLSDRHRDDRTPWQMEADRQREARAAAPPVAVHPSTMSAEALDAGADSEEVRAAAPPVEPLPWLIRFTCCGRADGVAARATWEEADALRQSYVAVAGHERSAVIEDALAARAAAPPVERPDTPEESRPDVPAPPSPDPVAGLREALPGALHEVGGEFCYPFDSEHPVAMHNSQAAALAALLDRLDRLGAGGGTVRPRSSGEARAEVGGSRRTLDRRDEERPDDIWPNGLGCPNCDGTGFVSDEMLDRIADSPYPYFAELVDRLRAASSPSPEPPE